MSEDSSERKSIEVPERDGPRRFLPALHWAKAYDLPQFSSDALAGILLASLLVPQAMAYAILAELPPQAGLYAAIVPALIYAALGTSRYLSLGPVALVSLLVGDAVSRAVAAHQVQATQAALILAFLVGLTLLAMGLLRLGFLVNFISDPVLSGFTSAAAVVIALSQAGNFLGITVEKGTFAQVAPKVIGKLPDSHWPTLALAATLLLLLTAAPKPMVSLMSRFGLDARRCSLIIKALPLMLLAMTAMASWRFSLSERFGIELVGAVPAGLPPFAPPPLDLSLMRSLAPSAFAIAAIVYITAMAVANSLAGRRRQEISSNQEAIAAGAANIASAFSGGYPVGASISRSAVNFDSGGKTPVSAAVAAAIVLVVVLSTGSMLAYIPTAMLAALIITAVFSLFDLEKMTTVWRYSKMEGLSMAVTFVGVLAIGVQGGVVVGALAGLTLYLWRTSRPRIVVEGRLEGSEELRSEERSEVEEPETSPILVLRVDENLYFGNTQYCENAVLSEVAEHDDVRVLLLNLKSVNDIDVTGFEMLKRLHDTLDEAGVVLAISEIKQPLRDALEKNGFVDKIGSQCIFLSGEKALESLKEQYA